MAELRMRKLDRRQFLQLTGIGLSATALAACVPTEQTMSGGDSAPAADSGAAPAAGGGTLVWLAHQEIAGLGPNDLGPTMQTIVIMAIHNSLIAYNFGFR